MDSTDEQFTYDDLGNRERVVNRDETVDTYLNNNVNEYTQIAINGVPRTPLYDPADNMAKNILTLYAFPSSVLFSLRSFSEVSSVAFLFCSCFVPHACFH